MIMLLTLAPHPGATSSKLRVPATAMMTTLTPSTSVRQDCISHAELRALLAQEGCSEGEIVEVFFELLHRTPPSSKARQCGSIPLDIFSDEFVEVAKEKTR